MARLNNDNDLGFSLRDYHHAAKTFTSEPGYIKLPYSGFLFHVNISFNDLTLTSLITGSRINPRTVGVLVKSTDLPSVKFETETLNQYNRKRIINKKVTYEPIKLTFHDDVANTVRNMWIAYNQHYSADSKYVFESTWALDNVYQNFGINRPYGLDTGNTFPFINKIEIYSMGNHEYSKMLLVNPIINSADFDNHDYSDGTKVMALNLTVEYESIIYSTGTTDQIPGFGDANFENYDQNFSNLGLSSLTDLLGSAPAAQSRVNTPLTSTNLTETEISARSIDPISGNVKQNLTRITENQYVSFKKEIVNGYTENQNFFTFPESRSSADVDNNILDSNISTYNSEIRRSLEISSNGQNIAMLNIEDDVAITPIPFSDTTATNEIIIAPNIPRNLTAAERTLFSRSYPPLPSTDPRAKLPPYV